MRFQTKTAFAYDRLREEILSGELKPGDKIVLSQLAEEYGMSPIPIREAISQLFREGLVHCVPYTSTQVASIDYRETLEITAIRYEIESICFQFAFPYITKEDIAALRALLNALQDAYYTGNYSAYIEKNRQFYSILYERCPLQDLKQYSDSLFKTRRINTTINAPHSVPESLRLHRLLVDQIEAGELQAAVSNHRYQKRYSMYAVVEEMERALKDPEHMKNSPVRVFFQIDGEEPDLKKLLSQIQDYKKLFDLFA